MCVYISQVRNKDNHHTNFSTFLQTRSTLFYSYCPSILPLSHLPSARTYPSTPRSSVFFFCATNNLLPSSVMARRPAPPLPLRRDPTFLALTNLQPLSPRSVSAIVIMEPPPDPGLKCCPPCHPAARLLRRSDLPSPTLSLWSAVSNNPS